MTCEHCDSKVSHFHQDGTGVVFNEHGVAFAVSPYHLAWAPLTADDDALPGAEYRQAHPVPSPPLVKPLPLLIAQASEA